jgi:hypothetical protein
MLNKCIYITRSKINKLVKIQKCVKKHLYKRNKNPYKYILYYYNKFLKKYGCKLPSKDSLFGKALEYLYINIKKQINIEDIRKYVKIDKKVGDSLQIRHLGLQYGFNLLKNKDTININEKIKKSHYLLYNLCKPYKNFYKDKRATKINDKNWNEIKKEYNFSCACCSNLENKPMRYNMNQLTILQKGHMDPRKPLILNNIIPQCGYCNQQYKNKAIFNKRGIVVDFNKNGF